MLRALLLENVHPVAVSNLRSAGFEVITRSGALDQDELIDALDGVHLLGIRSKTKVSAAAVSQASDLLAIGAFCIGTNQIELESIAELGVAAFNAPFSNTRSVVELALSEIIALTRRLTERSDSLHSGVWDKSASGAHEVRGRTLGIVGYGNIGSQLSIIAEALGMRVIFYDTAEKLSLGNAQRADSLDELLENSDAVTLHVDGRAGNAGFFGAHEFERMREGAIFLNLCRGFVVDLGALRERISSGHLAGAAIDVFPSEPKKQGDPFVSELRGLPNVILTPHIGGSTEEAQENIGHFVSGKLRDYISRGSTTLSVNMPNLSLPLPISDNEAGGERRIALLHRNTPGVLAEVNRVLASRGVNIDGQVLGTRGEVGYVLTDVADGIDRAVLEELEAFESTIQLRVLGGR